MINWQLHVNLWNLNITHDASTSDIQDLIIRLQLSIIWAEGLPSAKLFTHLDELDAGDLFQVHVLNKTMVYEIYEVEVVLPEDMDSLRISSDRNLITLVTCTPYGVNSHRILVHAEQTDKIISSDDDSTVRLPNMQIHIRQKHKIRDNFFIGQAPIVNYSLESCPPAV